MKTRRMWRVVPSKFSTRTVNPIRAIVDHLTINPNPDKEMIALSIGDPTIFGNLKPCNEVVEALVDSARSYKHNGYTPSVGSLEAREAVAKYESTPEVQVEPQDVILTSGCSHALELCLLALANPGDNILVPRPGFPIYATLVRALGVEVRYYDLLPENDWEVDLTQLAQLADERTAALVINNPSNPCGSVFSRSHLEELLDTAAQLCLPIVADEIYEHFVSDHL
ncbi:TAT [Cordylochernes scorpioides]|uniref:TAT n=1 Tax=Cordylochernes scorpioides TaxID=51811 RepID=A0ABY6K4V2_9ARAC|nr:TAT [Cordylochernes scorpioides]